VNLGRGFLLDGSGFDFELLVECSTDRSGVHEDALADLVVRQKPLGFPLIECSERRAVIIGEDLLAAGFYSD